MKIPLASGGMMTTCSSRSTSPGSSLPPLCSLPSSTKAAACPATISRSVKSDEEIKPKMYTVRNTFIDFDVENSLATNGREILSCPASRIGMMRLPPIAVPSDSEAVAPTAAANDIALGTPEMPTVGSMEHSIGNCRPCAFFHKRGCENGVQCKFCHLCDPGEKRRRQKEKKAQFRQQQEDTLEPGHHAAGDILPPVQLPASPAAPVGSPVLRRPPAAIVLDDEEDVLDRVTNALPLSTPLQPWPATPAEYWPPTPADNHRPSVSFETNLGGLTNTNNLFSAPMMTAATMEDQSQRLWQVATLPPIQHQNSSFAPAATIAALSENQRPPPVLRLAESLLDPVLGSAELPSAGSRTHRFGTCRPCAFLHKQGCGNGLHCEFCHLCDPGEKKRRQKQKKVQLQNVKQEAEALISIGCLD